MQERSSRYLSCSSSPQWRQSGIFPELWKVVLGSGKQPIRSSPAVSSATVLGSTLAAFFGVLTEYITSARMLVLLAMTKIVNRFALSIQEQSCLILCGLFPKLAALISIMPQSVLGGAAVMMFSSIVDQWYSADHKRAS